MSFCAVPLAVQIEAIVSVVNVSLCTGVSEIEGCRCPHQKGITRSSH